MIATALAIVGVFVISLFTIGSHMAEEMRAALRVRKAKRTSDYLKLLASEPS